MYLFRISMRYLRAQKLRTTLTWLCIALAVLLLSTTGALASTLYSALVESTVMQNGNYEVDIDLNSKYATFDADVLKNSNLVDQYALDYVSKGFEEYNAIPWEDMTTEQQIERRRSTLVNTITINGDTILFVGGCLQMQQLEAESANLYSTYDVALVSGRYPENENEIVLPHSLKSLAVMEKESQYSIMAAGGDLPVKKWGSYVLGDQITFTYSEDTYRLNEEHPEVKETLQEESWLGNYALKGFCDTPDNDKIILTEEGVKKEKTYTIVGFSGAMYGSMMFCFHPDDTLLSDYYSPSSARVRLDQNLDYDEALGQLLDDALLTGNASDARYIPNDMLLFLKFRGVEARADWVQTGAALCFGALLIMMVARLFIDNAFEMSTQERVRQFGMLRTIGATKGQVAAIVLFEALFYICTTIPVAMLTSIGVGKALLAMLGDALEAIQKLESLPIPDIRFSFLPPVAIGTVLLCVLAILISSYTSAMWASKQPPVDALSFGRPKISKSEERALRRREKSSAKRRAKSTHRFGFVPYYAKMNKKRNKKRYCIAIFSSMIGITLFISIATFTTVMMEELAVEMDASVMRMGYDAGLTEQEVSEQVAAYAETGNFEMTVATVDDYLELLDSNFAEGLLPGAREVFETAWLDNDLVATLTYIDRHTYQTYLEKETGISFDEWAKSDKAFVTRDMTLMIEDEYRVTQKPYQLFDENVDFLLKSQTRVWSHDKPEPEVVEKTVHLAGAVDPEILPQFMQANAKYNMLIFRPLTDEVLEQEPVVFCLRPLEKKYDAALEVFNKAQENDARLIWTEDGYTAASAMRKLMQFAVTAIMYVLAIFFFINIFNIMNTVHTSIMNRQRELAMVRAVGMTRSQMRASIILEAVNYIIVSVIIGTIVSAGIVYLFQYGVAMFVASGWIVYLLLYALIVLIVGGIFSVLSVFPSLHTAERNEVMEVIREIN